MGINIDPAIVAKVLAICTALGVVLPLLQSVIQRPSWSPRAKAILTVILSIVSALVTYIIDNGLDFSSPEKMALWFVGVYGFATQIYARLLRPAGATDYLEHKVNGDEHEVVQGEVVDNDGQGDG